MKGFFIHSLISAATRSGCLVICGATTLAVKGQAKVQVKAHFLVLCIML